MLRLGFVQKDWDTFRAGDQILFGSVACPIADSDWVVVRADRLSNKRVVSEEELYQLLYGEIPPQDADLITLNQERSIEVPLGYRVPAYSRYLYMAVLRDEIEIVAGISDDSITGTCLPLVVLAANLIYAGKTKVTVLRFCNGGMPGKGTSLFDGLATDLIKKLPDRAWAEMEQNAP